MTITYQNFEEFHKGIAELVMLGLTFNACAADLTVVLTGGY